MGETGDSAILCYCGSKLRLWHVCLVLHCSLWTAKEKLYYTSIV